ncbi:MAG: NADH-quinone oxidoreductase subunit NuoH [Gemmatimonadetes bacterium]|nr:NADH-quinone oxidoreductase subunit NuoH [Gemmatimonadota bacterium]
MRHLSLLPQLDLASWFPRADAQRAPDALGTFLAATTVKMLVLFVAVLGTVTLLTLAERKVAAWIQDRRGPNRLGPGGLLQPIADGLKNFMKEEVTPLFADRVLFVLAPALAFVPALLTWAVIPVAAPLPTPWGLIEMVVAPLPVGFLFTLAISSLGVYGIVLAGWSSNNKYALLGGLRSSAQMVSYEVAMGMSTIPVLLLAGNVSLNAIVQQQATMGWNILSLTVAWFTFLVAAFAETNRLPFDLPEAESELVAGYHTEYSGMKFAMFFIAEYANMITVSAMTATLFLGGWDIPFTTWDNAAPYSVLKTLVTFVAFASKVGFFLFLFMWVRWTLPRFRYDQLMALGWSVMLPVALGYIVLIAVASLVLDMLGVARGPLFSLALLGLNIVVIAILLRWLDRGKLISPASARVGHDGLERLRARGLEQAAPRIATTSEGAR